VVVDASTVELVPGSGEILQVGMLATYKKTQSDHVPVRARFYTDMPDDD